MIETQALREARSRQATILAGRTDANECCRDPRNLVTIEDGWQCYLSTCTQCGVRHRRMVAEPGNVFARGN